MGKSTISIAIFNSYVSSPEGRFTPWKLVRCITNKNQVKLELYVAPNWTRARMGTPPCTYVNVSSISTWHQPSIHLPGARISSFFQSSFIFFKADMMAASRRTSANFRMTLELPEMWKTWWPDEAQDSWYGIIIFDLSPCLHMTSPVMFRGRLKNEKTRHHFFYPIAIPTTPPKKSSDNPIDTMPNSGSQFLPNMLTSSNYLWWGSLVAHPTIRTLSVVPSCDIPLFKAAQKREVYGQVLSNRNQIPEGFPCHDRNPQNLNAQCETPKTDWTSVIFSSYEKKSGI